MGFPAWQGAARCTDSATHGAQALMRFIIERYGSKGAANWGIYNCRTVRGGSTTSLHGEGRALDVGFPLGDPDGDELLRRLLRVPGRLGVQAIIYERRIYSALSPDGRPYTGVAPHYDHLHIELTREAAQKLTYETVKRVLHRQPRRAGSRPLRKGDSGADVRWLQGKLRIEADGEFGPVTEAAVMRFEEQAKERFKGKLGIKADGVMGRNSWKAVGAKPTF
jgi:hypothetical protein